MKKMKVLALALAMSIAAGAVGTTTLVALAAPYTQADTPDQVSYGVLTQQEFEIVCKYFDAAYYASKYDDVVEALGTDEALLLEHFVKCGIFEGREGWPTFNASAYSSAYPDLKDMFGHDIVKYFVHYYTKGMFEGRDITTIEACEKAGIKVISLFDEDDFVTAEIYAASNLLGTNDYKTVQQAAEAAVEKGAAIVNTPDTTTVIVTKEVAEKMENLIEEPTVEEETPVVVNTPVAEETPAAEETPIVEKQPAEEETPAVEETPVVEEQPAAEETPVVEEQPAAEETPAVEKKSAKENAHYQKIGSFSVNGDRECVILVYRNTTGEGFSTKYYNDICDILKDVENKEICGCSIVGFIPSVIFTAQEANSLCENEGYDIPSFDIKEGNIIGTEGVILTTTNEFDYLTPSDFTANHQRKMTNYVNGIYMDNAYVGGDENGTNETEYEVGTIATEDENGDAQVVAVISNDETGFNYEVTYTFNGDPYGFYAAKEAVADSEAEATTESETVADTEETVEETVEESVEE